MSRQNRLGHLVGTILLGVCILAIGCPSPSNNGPSKPVFKVAILTFPGYAPLYLAKEKGFFEGIEVEIQRIDDTAAKRSALTSGRIDAATDIVDSFSNALAGGLDAKAFLKLDDSLGGDGIVVKEEIKSIKDLRGKKWHIHWDNRLTFFFSSC